MTRIVWVDYVKAFAIVGVLLVHTAIPEPAKRGIYVALIPVFFYVAGLFARTNKELAPCAFFRRQWRRLLFPYLFFNALHYVLWWVAGRHFGADSGSAVSAWRPLWGIVWGNADGLTHYVPLWFLACLFVAETLYYFCVLPSLSRKAKILRTGVLGAVGYVLSSLSVELPWGLTPALVMVIFYGLGDLTRNAVLRPTWGGWRWNGAVVLAAIAFVVAWFYNDQVSVHRAAFGCFPLFLLGAAGGIVLSVAAARGLARWLPVVQPLVFLGQNTLILLVTHLAAYSLTKGFTTFVLHWPLTVYDSVGGAVALVVATLTLSVPFILIINRFVPALAGKRKSNA